jgi:hypothetical protein
MQKIRGYLQKLIPEILSFISLTLKNSVDIYLSSQQIYCLLKHSKLWTKN